MPRSSCQRLLPAVLGLALCAVVAPPVLAQKNSGPLLPVNPAPRPPPAYAAPRPPPPAPQAGAAQGANPDAERLAQSLPLDPQTRELRDQMPANPQGVERRLGLREPHGRVVDLRGRLPSSREIVDALAPR